MLDQRDLELLQKMMEFVVDSRMTESEQRMDSKLAEAENLLLEEMDRMQTNLSKHIEKIDWRLDSMQHDINACKLEAGTLDLLLKRIDRLESRLEELEKKTA